MPWCSDHEWMKCELELGFGGLGSTETLCCVLVLRSSRELA
jgi:hypothetical protein